MQIKDHGCFLFDPGHCFLNMIDGGCYFLAGLIPYSVCINASHLCPRIAMDNSIGIHHWDDLPDKVIDVSNVLEEVFHYALKHEGGCGLDWMLSCKNPDIPWSGW